MDGDRMYGGAGMDLRQLRYFLAIVDAGSFSGAAAALGVTQQTLSKSIRALEADLGVRLFDRDTRHVALTGHGDMVLAHARNMDAEAQQLRRHIDDALGVRTGRLRIGAGLTAAAQIVPTAIARLVGKRPGLRVSVTDGSARTLTPMLLRGELDVIVCVIGTPIEDPLVQQDVLFHERMQILAGADHSLVASRKVRLKQCLEYPWLVGWSPGGFDKTIAAAFTRAGLTPPVPRIETTSFTLARAVLTTTETLAVLPEHLFAMELTAGTLARIEAGGGDGWERPMSICYRRNSTRSPATMALISELYALAAGKKPPVGLRAGR
jgi:DNA-binding transcriptional LysR family regulator